MGNRDSSRFREQKPNESSRIGKESLWFNDAEDLSAIRVGAHDEIYQASQPVLVGMDVASTYCYLLEAVNHCDETTWGVHLLELRDRGLQLDYTIADAGQALRAGQKAAWGDLPCHGDIFHAEKSLTELSSSLANRARACTAARQKIEHKYERIERSCKRQTLGRKLYLVRREEHKALALAADVRALADWMCRDILALAGPSLTERQELYDFLVTELHRCQGDGPDPSRQFPRRESQQPITQLLLPASRDRARIPGPAAVLSESPAVPPERPARASGQEPRRAADRPDAAALAGTAWLHEIPS